MVELYQVDETTLSLLRKNLATRLSSSLTFPIFWVITLNPLLAIEDELEILVDCITLTPK
ncbi:hypothetical protein B9J93_12015 [Vibrio sp. V17_P4S1T151]|nr:hypothetical protein B9J93_12015 [Vibrio sp. V17_P4S1T151]